MSLRNTKPKILIWDIETAHNVMAVFDLLNKNMIPHQNILKERYIISVAYKFIGERKVQAVSILDDMKRFKKDPNDDFAVVAAVHKVIEGADAIVGHYGDKYDLPFLNTRLIYHGFKPLPPIIQYDTYKMAKQKFKFNSNRLDYIGKMLGLGSKITTSHGLWLRCLRGEVSAIKEMIRYNKQDVALLEKVFNKLAPFVATKLNLGLFTDKAVCPHCNGTNLQRRGLRYTVSNAYERFQCTDCGKWSSGKKSIKTAEVK